MWTYNYDREDSQFDLRDPKSTKHWLYHEVTFHSAFANRYQKDGIANGEYFLPRSGSYFPLVILIHGFGSGGERDAVPCQIMARDLAKIGIAAFVLHFDLPVKEVKDTSGNRLLLPIVDGWLEVYRMLVINVRQVIDWAEGRNELDEHKIAVNGISMGGITCSIAMAVDQRIAAGVFLVAGGDMEVLTWDSKCDISRITHGCSREECRRVYSVYPQYLADVYDRGVENVMPMKDCFLFDPITFAPRLRGRPMLMINAKSDDFVPRESTLEMWEALGTKSSLLALIINMGKLLPF